MKHMWHIYWASSAVRRMVTFQSCFFFGMWLSKLIHPLWFAQHHTLLYFSYGYSAMAVCGYLAPYWGSVGQRWGFGRVIGCGALLYSVGLGLRVFPDSAMAAILSGLIAGIGAAAATVCLRGWTAQIITAHEKTATVGLRDGVRVGATAIAMLVGGWMPAIFPEAGWIYPLLLLMAAGCVAMAGAYLVWASRHDERASRSVPRSEPLSLRTILRTEPRLCSAVLGFGALTGFVTSLVLPYLPVILRELHFSLPAIGTVSALNFLLAALTYPVLVVALQRWAGQRLMILVAVEVLHAGIVLALGCSWPMPAIVILLSVRAICASLAAFCEEVLWLVRFPTASAGALFGALQSGFFLGDSLGGPLAAWLLTYSGLPVLLRIAAGGLVLHAVLFALFVGAQRTAFTEEVGHDTNGALTLS